MGFLVEIFYFWWKKFFRKKNFWSKNFFVENVWWHDFFRDFFGGTISKRNNVTRNTKKKKTLGVSLGLIKSEENLLHQILKEDLRESLPATFLIYFLCVFPKPSLRRAKSKDFAINPSAPISIAKSSTVHPFSFKAVFNFAYLAIFRSCTSTIFLSKGTMFSNQIIRFFDTEKITMSGR